MDKTFWAEYRRAFKILLFAAGWAIASVASGYALGQLEHVPSAVAVTPAPSGSGQLGRAPAIVRTTPTRAVPRRPPASSWKPRRQPRKPPTATVEPTPSPSPSPSTNPESSPAVAPSRPQISPTL